MSILNNIWSVLLTKRSRNALETPSALLTKIGCFISDQLEQAFEQAVELPINGGAMAIIWRTCNVSGWYIPLPISPNHYLWAIDFLIIEKIISHQWSLSNVPCVTFTLTILGILKPFIARKNNLTEKDVKIYTNEMKYLRVMKYVGLLSFLQINMSIYIYIFCGVRTCNIQLDHFLPMLFTVNVIFISGTGPMPCILREPCGYWWPCDIAPEHQ